MEPIAFAIFETPLGQFTLRHYTKDSALDYGPFPDKAADENGMTRIITPTVYRYNAIGTLLEK